MQPLYARIVGRTPRVGVLIVPFLEKEYGERIRRSLEAAGASATFLEFTGECCWDEIDRLRTVLQTQPIDVLISVGGGK